MILELISGTINKNAGRISVVVVVITVGSLFSFCKLSPGVYGENVPFEHIKVQLTVI